MTVHNSKANELGNAFASLHPAPMQYRKLRAPKADGDSLHVPSFNELQSIWESNLATNLSSGQFDSFQIAELRNTARIECADLARNYTARYLQVDLSSRNQDRFIYSGHQPALFHPGVWYKNFTLSHLAQHFNCIPVNLIVDNDICGTNSIRIPTLEANQAISQSIPIDAHGDNIPFEARTIVDRTLFDSFAKRTASAIAPLVPNPLVESLWPKVIDSIDSENRLGHAIASGRHLLEHEIGLQTLELPISLLSQTAGFAAFVQELVLRREQIVSVYNQCLWEYRKVHKIRSNSHPVPELEIREQWFELPFWIWHRETPVRRNLLCRVTADQVELSDGSNIVAKLELKHFVEQFRELRNRQICVRPKALMTTMFSRLILSDMFLHGIGGSKYDQMTDAIIGKLFDVTPPRFLTLTATLKLPTNVPIVDVQDVTKSRVELREMQFHPERFIENPDHGTKKIIETKHRWIAKRPLRGNRLERHHTIERCNQKLRESLDRKKTQLSESLDQMQSKLQTCQIMGSREFSFCLFPESLPQKLQQMAQQPIQ